MTNVSKVSFKGSADRKGYQAVKKTLDNSFKNYLAELKEVGVPVYGLSKEDILRIHSDPVISKKIAKLRSLNATKNYQAVDKKTL